MTAQLQQEIKEIECLYIKDLVLAKKKLAIIEEKPLLQTESIQISLLKAKIFIFEGKTKEAQIIFEELDKLSWASLDESLKAEFFLNFAQNLIYLGNQEIGLERANLALEIFSKTKNLAKMSSIYILFGNVFYSNAKYDLALENYQKGLNIAVEKKSDQYLRSLASIGNIHFVRGQLYESTKYMIRARELANDMEDLRMFTLISLNLGLNLFLQGDFNKALIVLNEGLSTADKLGNELFKILLKNMKALYWMTLGNINEAQVLLDSIEHDFDELSFPHAKLENDLARAKLFLLQGKIKSSYILLQKTIKFADDVNRKVNTIEILCLFAEIADSLEYGEEAYQSILKANELALLDQSDIDRARILTSRSKINLLNNSLNEAKIQILEALWLTKKTHAIELEYQAQLVLVQILVEKFNATKDQNILNEITNKIEESLKFASKYGLIPYKIQSLTMQGLLQISQKKYKDAYQSWSLGLELAQKAEMTNKCSQLIEYLKLFPKDFLDDNNDLEIFTEDFGVKIRENVIKNQTSLTNYAYSLLQEQISQVTKTLSKNKISQESLNEIFIVTFKIDDVYGPSVHNCTYNSTDESWINKLQHIAAIYYLTIGQGSSYYRGLFGPLPFVDPQKRALIFAADFDDSSIKDNRMAKKNYVLITIVFPMNLTPIFYDHQQISSNFTDFLDSVKKIEDLSEQKLKRFIKTLTRNLLPKEFKDYVQED